MPLAKKISTLLMLLGVALVCACGSTQALRPRPAEIPLSQSLTAACEQVIAPDAAHMPAQANAGEAAAYLAQHNHGIAARADMVTAAEAYARAVQLRERAFWEELDLAVNGVSARQCARYMELRDLVIAYNSEVRAAAQSWPR